MPITVTEYVLAVLELHERLAVPEPEMVLGEIGLQVRPVGTVSVRVTEPENPLRALTVIVDVAEAPTVAEGEVAAMVKSTKLKVAVAVWTRDPLVPVIMSEYVPATVALHDAVAVPAPVTVPGVIVPQVNPAGTVSVRVTTPAKPLTAVIVVVDVADRPTLTAAGEDAATVKSTKLKTAVVE